MSTATIKTAEEKGRKLGLLIISLKITDDEREAMLALLPRMTEIQIDDFIEALEINYLQAMTQEEDKKLAQGLQKVEENFQLKVSQIILETNKALDLVV